MHLIGEILLPVFVLLMLGAIAGVKPEAMIKPIFELFGLVLKVTIETIGLIVRLTLEALVFAVVSRKMDVRFKSQNPLSGPKPQKVKVTVVEDHE